MSADHELSPERAAELLSSGAAQAIDVRTRHEYDAGRLADARHVELARLSEEGASLGALLPVFYCRSGERSAMAAEAFTVSGREAYSIEGGLLAWAERGLPLEPADGMVAPRRPGE